MSLADIYLIEKQHKVDSVIINRANVLYSFISDRYKFETKVFLNKDNKIEFTITNKDKILSIIFLWSEQIEYKLDKVVETVYFNNRFLIPIFDLLKGDNNEQKVGR